jgi:hypothetical protein
VAKLTPPSESVDGGGGDAQPFRHGAHGQEVAFPGAPARAAPRQAQMPALR